MEKTISDYALPAVLGIHPHMTSLELWAQMTGRMKSDISDERRIMGAKIKRAIADAYGEIRHRDVGPATTMTHPERTIATARPTALVRRTTGGTIEAALLCQQVSPWAAKDWGEPDTDEVPEHVLARATWIAEVVGARVDVVVPSDGLAVYHVEPDPDYFDSMCEEAERWIRDYVIADKAPTATLSDEAVLRSMCRVSRGSSVAVPAHLLEAYDNARAMEAQFETQKKEAKVALMQALGDSDAGIADGWTCTYKNNKSGHETNWEQLARRLGATPELIAEFTQDKPGARVLRVKKAKR